MGGINLKNNVELNIDLIIEEYSHYVFTIIYNLAGNKLSYHDIEEIIADTFYLFWKNQDNIENIKSYLAVIAKNCTYNKLKQAKQYIKYNDQILNKYRYFQKDDFNYMLIIEEKMQRLTDEEKEIFQLYYIEGYKIKMMTGNKIAYTLYERRLKMKKKKLKKSNV